MNRAQVTDPFTNERFIPKRSNQIYASAKNRADCNNEKAGKIRKQKKTIQSKLNQNWKAFMLILDNKKSIIRSREFLNGAGVDLRYNTAMSKTPDGTFTFFLVYDLIIYELQNNQFKIEK